MATTENQHSAAAGKEKELSRLAKLERQGRAVPPGVLDPLMAVLVQVWSSSYPRFISTRESHAWERAIYVAVTGE